MNAEAWTAFGTWVLVIGTLVAVWWQVRQQREINSANTVMRLHDRFESSIMRNHRIQLSTVLSSGETINQRDDQILVFFETLGLLTHQGILNVDMIWNEFCWETVRYYAALTRPTNRIAQLREDSHDKTLYSEFEWLNKRLLEIDCKKRGVGQEVVLPNQLEIKSFLEDECNLIP